MAESTRNRILLIDDDKSILELYSKVLTADGYEVVREASSITALDRLTSGEKFDLVITDIMMAKMDGWELIDMIRNGVGLSSTQLPVIVISAHFSSDVLEVEAFKRGASSTYAKTQPLSRLLHEVRIHTGRQRSRFDDDTLA